MPYPHTINTLRKRIKEKNYKLDNTPSDITHVLYMFKRIIGMHQNSLKAARWIGWALKALEDQKILTNEESRALIRIDVSNGDQ